MIYPSIDHLVTKVDSKYTLVVAAAKRARQLNEGMSKLIETTATKDVSVALAEIATGKIRYERLKSGLK